MTDKEKISAEIEQLIKVNTEYASETDTCMQC